MRYVQVVIGVLAVILPMFLGCQRTDSNTSDIESIVGKSVPLVKELQIDLGLLENDHVFDCLLCGDDIKTVKKVIRSCGCVGPNIRDGEQLAFNKSFQVSISLSNKAMGNGVQDFLSTLQMKRRFALK